MKNKKLKMMVGAFIFVFFVITFAWQIPKVFAEETLMVDTPAMGGGIIAVNQIKFYMKKMGTPAVVTGCDATKIHIDVNGGGLSPLTATSCSWDDAWVFATFSGTPWTDPTVGIAAENGLYLDAGAVTDQDADTNMVGSHESSTALPSIQGPRMSSATRSSNTELVLLFAGLTGATGNCYEGFTVADANNPLVTYSISECGISEAEPRFMTFTVANVSASIVNGLKITFEALAGGNEGPYQYINYDNRYMTTDATGVTIASWSPPTMSSAVVNSNTQITVTLSKLAASDTITKSNSGGFTVTAGNNTYEVTAIAPGVTNAKVVLTVADMSASAVTGVTVKYATGEFGTVADEGSISMETDAIGVETPEFLAPTMLSAVKDTTTQISVTLSELADSRTITKSNDSGFVVTQVGALTTFSVSAVAPGETNDIVVLTVADMSAAESAGVKVTYNKASGQGDNGAVTDANGNYLATDSTGVSIAAWATGRRSSTVTTTTDTSTGSDSTTTTVIPTPTVTATYGQTQTTTVSAEGTTAAMSFGSAVSFPVNGASVSVSVSSLANPAEGTASVVVEVGAMASAKLKEQRLKAQSLKLDLDLKVGVPKQVDVDGDGVMDLEINLEEVVSITDVKITIKTLEKASIVDETVEEPKVIKDYTDGKWVKDLTHSAVYFIDKTNVRHIYLTKSIWSSYFGDDFSRVMIVPTAEILSYTIGESVPFKAGSLIKTTTSPKVYQVDVDGTLQWMVNETVAKRIVGTDWQKKIVDVSEVVLGEFKMGIDLE
jgi:hypothetical protein